MLFGGLVCNSLLVRGLRYVDVMIFVSTGALPAYVLALLVTSVHRAWVVLKQLVR